jgi:hypothetical protein
MASQTNQLRALYDRQIVFLEAKDVDGLIDNNYNVDAVLMNFDFEVRGNTALKKHFTGYLAHLGYIKLISTDRYIENEDSIFFEATVETAGGVARVYDVFVLANGKIAKHFTGLLGFTPRS